MNGTEEREGRTRDQVALLDPDAELQRLEQRLEQRLRGRGQVHVKQEPEPEDEEEE